MSKVTAVCALSLILMVTLAGVSCSGNEESEPAIASPSETSPEADVAVEETLTTDGIIRVADTGTGYEWINNELLKLIAEGAFDLVVEIIPVAPEDLEQALMSGDVDIHMEARTPETANWNDAAVTEGTLVNLGTTYETEDDFAVQKSATRSFVASYPELVSMLEKMDTRSRSLGKTVIWAEKRGDVEGEEAAAYYMYTFDFEDRMKSWMPFEKYRIAKAYMENLYPDFRRCTNCPEPDPDAPGGS